jgi:tRNA(fMet)-specific endonuclease VapC
MMKILLDTNAYSAFMTGDQSVFDHIIEAERIYLSTIMIGELFAGFLGGRRAAENIEELKCFLKKDGVIALDVTMETSEIFGEIKAALKQQGKMIPINDIWIAAHVFETGSKLITYDTHFKQINGLRLWDKLTSSGRM